MVTDLNFHSGFRICQNPVCLKRLRSFCAAFLDIGVVYIPQAMQQTTKIVMMGKRRIFENRNSEEEGMPEQTQDVEILTCFF